MKKITWLLLTAFFIQANLLLAQPANDDSCGAHVLMPTQELNEVSILS